MTTELIVAFCVIVIFLGVLIAVMLDGFNEVNRNLKKVIPTSKKEIAIKDDPGKYDRGKRIACDVLLSECNCENCGTNCPFAVESEWINGRIIGCKIQMLRGDN